MPCPLLPRQRLGRRGYGLVTPRFDVGGVTAHWVHSPCTRPAPASITVAELLLAAAAACHLKLTGVPAARAAASTWPFEIIANLKLILLDREFKLSGAGPARLALQTLCVCYPAIVLIL
jgi:hypothetical protein